MLESHYDSRLQSPNSEAVPFTHFYNRRLPLTPWKEQIANAHYRAESACVADLLPHAILPEALVLPVKTLASRLVQARRACQSKHRIDSLLHEFSLSSHEGVVLMCLAEALLRIPDAATRDALIRDKINGGAWASHLNNTTSLFVHAAIWGLVLTGKWVTHEPAGGWVGLLKPLVQRLGTPLVRHCMTFAIRLLGEQFITGQTIAQALANSRPYEARGFCYSYDMLGEAALTSEDAQLYYKLYEQAIHALGQHAAGRGVYLSPGISIKLSALHPRYTYAQAERVKQQLIPQVLALSQWAKHYDIGLNIDAEEADRLELSLEIVEALCQHQALAGWHGLGLAVQAYQKRSPAVIDYLIDLAQRTSRRLMVRLVKGAYWDTEIKRAQSEGLEDYPVYTRKVHTDVCYLACARKLLSAPNAIYPQFATHNAQTIASIYHLAGESYAIGQYEFQCLYGMGEVLYQEIVGLGEQQRPCRVYAPVGTHEHLLAYLVRRILENGANTSFVHQMADPSIAVDVLTEDPVHLATKIVPSGSSHPAIPLPPDLYRPYRANARSLDLSSSATLTMLSNHFLKAAHTRYHAAPLGAELNAIAEGLTSEPINEIRNPANPLDVVGYARAATPNEIDTALATALAAAYAWGNTPVHERAAILKRAADEFERQIPAFMSLLIREAGKTAKSALAEIREAIDFLRYYAAQIEREFNHASHLPLGPIVCISPWNFPLAIFIGQVAAALAAGNPVLAKPAEQTPLIAFRAVQILYHAGVPKQVLQLLLGEGKTVGAHLVADTRSAGVIFTGSTQTAQSIAQTLAQRCVSEARLIPLIAETGGQNAMIVDSSALLEQVVSDALTSAFDSAGQRCSALRILCLQEEIAERTLHLLKGAMQAWVVGNPDCLATDMGPVINTQAQHAIHTHIQALAAQGCSVYQPPLPHLPVGGTFVAPTLIEIPHLNCLKHEIFGPVLHVLRYPRHALHRLLEAINATGYGLTLGIQTRIDEVAADIAARARVGNIYINRNMIGAVVGVQPFGGRGLSGTGPKAGGPLYLYRLLKDYPALNVAQLFPAERAIKAAAAPLHERAIVQAVAQRLTQHDTEAFSAFQHCVQQQGDQHTLALSERYLRMGLPSGPKQLPGPTGESNSYMLSPRGTLLGVPTTERGAHAQIAAALASGNRLCLLGPIGQQVVSRLPTVCQKYISVVQDESAVGAVEGVLAELPAESLGALMLRLTTGTRGVLPLQNLPLNFTVEQAYRIEHLLNETVISINTAAAGGNASLVMMD